MAKLRKKGPDEYFPAGRAGGPPPAALRRALLQAFSGAVRSGTGTPVQAGLAGPAPIEGVVNQSAAPIPMASASAQRGPTAPPVSPVSPMQPPPPQMAPQTQPFNPEEMNGTPLEGPTGPEEEVFLGTVGPIMVGGDDTGEESSADAGAEIVQRMRDYAATEGLQGDELEAALMQQSRGRNERFAQAQLQEPTSNRGYGPQVSAEPTLPPVAPRTMMQSTPPPMALAQSLREGGQTLPYETQLPTQMGGQQIPYELLQALRGG